VLPFINDTKENVTGILRYCVEAGVYGIICFGMGLTLREGDREYFYNNLDRRFPGLKEKYQKRYGNNYILTSDKDKELVDIFNRTCDEHGIVRNADELFNHMRTFEGKSRERQQELF
jgi:DNA repair photolyase